MNRKQFLSTCSSGLCACALMNPVSSSASEESAAPLVEDWKLPFVQKRYAKLLEILAEETDEKTVEVVLKLLGRFCAGGMEILKKHEGDVDGFIREFSEQYNEQITYDREKGVITVIGSERTHCFCPLVSSTTPRSVCSCSLGWQEQVYETLIGNEVTVELKESVQRGGKRCVFEIKVSDRAGAERNSGVSA